MRVNAGPPSRVAQLEERAEFFDGQAGLLDNRVQNGNGKVVEW
jgi:hypothetical protein